MKDKIYFISDVHLGSGTESQNEERERYLLDFLRSIRGTATMLYIVGDLFDFWFEYRTVVPSRSAKVLFELYNLVQSGTKVIYIVGNHDFWLGSYIEKQVGIEIVRDATEIEIQGLRLWIAHGDGVSNEYGYRLLKSILRNRVSIELFSLIHPDIAARIAQLVSSSSRENVPNKKKSEEELLALYLNAALEKFSSGYDAVIFGHLHLPTLRKEGSHTFVVLGDWIINFSYLVLTQREFSLRFWPGTDPLPHSPFVVS